VLMMNAEASTAIAKKIIKAIKRRSYHK
jgi:hypothetical protein